MDGGSDDAYKTPGPSILSPPPTKKHMTFPTPTDFATRLGQEDTEDSFSPTILNENHKDSKETNNDDDEEEETSIVWK